MRKTHKIKQKMRKKGLIYINVSHQNPKIQNQKKKKILKFQTEGKELKKKWIKFVQKWPQKLPPMK